MWRETTTTTTRTTIAKEATIISSKKKPVAVADAGLFYSGSNLEKEEEKKEVGRINGKLTSDNNIFVGLIHILYCICVTSDLEQI